MFCSKCGKEIENINSFCPFCGEPVAVQTTPQPVPPTEAPVQYYQAAPTTYQQTNYPPQYAPQYAPQPAVPQQKSKKGLILAIVLPCAAVFTLIVILLASFIVKANEKAELQEKLLRDWSRVESTGSSYYTLRLDFDDDEIEYIFDSTYVDDTIATYEYELIDGDTIRVEGIGNVDIEFNDDETMMTFTPSITDTKSSENWFNFD